MNQVLTTAEMRWLEERFIQGNQEIETKLMETAGVQAALEFQKWFSSYPNAENKKVTVLCGPGNNGGDGFVIARNLHHEGFSVECFEIKPKGKRSLASETKRKLWNEINPAHRLENLTKKDLSEMGVVIDALFGIGLKRSIGKETCKILNQISSDIPIIAIDILSGLNSDTGELMSEKTLHWSADLTITFQLSKWGHHLKDGPHRTGLLKVVSIGLEEQLKGLYAEDTFVPNIFLPNKLELKSKLSKNYFQHKYHHGNVLVLTGGLGMIGAAKLTARSALRVGAGLVTLGTPKEVFSFVANQVQSLMAASVNSSEDLLEVIHGKKINTVCIGMGFGIGSKTRRFVSTILNQVDKVVLDADALTSFEDFPEELFELQKSDTVLTPHWGEFRRLFSDLSEQNSSGKMATTTAVIEASKLSKATVLLKGMETIIAHPSGKCSVCKGSFMEHVPWLATAGSGDVLAGLIAGLMARGLESFEATIIAVYLHQLLANFLGPGLISEDLPDAIPNVFKLLKVN